jgi:hypothetical protein
MKHKYQLSLSVLLFLLAFVSIVVIPLKCASASDNFTSTDVKKQQAKSIDPATLTFDSPATVSVTWPRGSVYCVTVPVHWTLTEHGVEAHMTVPGPIAGKPWTCRSYRTWDSLFEEFETRVDEFAVWAKAVGAKRLVAWIEQARNRP